ncbi:unnamed protein product [Hermetia illucens]|uniref:Inositol-1-monophosphatase n=1 Tax=Hermetia illucens TaxID=343691 RepID=A0A7R8YRZ9_HERIL|nr:inositol monophosphatase 1 [Hermetia illucens]CAD7083238.1 unnamed protein product [Hermetia illucens]
MASDLDLDKCYQTILTLVDEAGKIVASRNSERKSYEQKSGDIDLLTVTDKEVEKLLIDRIKADFPSHKFIGEEGSSSGESKCVLTDDPTWIIDPVDGTMNFVHSFPHSCISVGLFVNKVPEIGVIYNPMLNQKFTARRGKGAFYNGNPVHVSGEKELSKALITSEFGSSRDPEKMQVVNENFQNLSKIIHGFRILGACALDMSMVAIGAADACYEMGIHIWDIAAAILIVREAGGVAIDPSGGELDVMSRRCLVAASPELAAAIAKNLKQYYPKPRDDEC